MSRASGRRGAWLLVVSVVVGNAALQAATTLPAVTPGSSLSFWALAATSGISVVLALAAVLGRMRAMELGASAGSANLGDVEEREISGDRPGRFAASSALFALLVTLIVGLAAVLWSPLVLLTVPLGLIAAASWVATGGVYRGFRVFTRRPWAAAMLAVLSVGVVALLWLGALFSGFFIAGWFSALVTWLAFGFVGTGLLATWARLMKPRPA